MNNSIYIARKTDSGGKKMEGRELNLNGGWEDIVNNVERHNARVRFDAARKQTRRNKRIGKVVDLALFAVLLMVLGFSGLVANWIAGPVAGLMICAACFFGGRLWEEYHK